MKLLKKLWTKVKEEVKEETICVECEFHLDGPKDEHGFFPEDEHLCKANPYIVSKNFITGKMEEKTSLIQKYKTCQFENLSGKCKKFKRKEVKK